jgi:hypothetical protein
VTKTCCVIGAFEMICIALILYLILGKSVKILINEMKFLSGLPIINAYLSTNESSWVVVVVAPKMHNL